MDIIGEITGLANSFFFALTSLIFASTGRMVGSQVTNRIRLILALLYLAVLNVIFFGKALVLAGAIIGTILGEGYRSNRFHMEIIDQDYTYANGVSNFVHQ